MTLSATNQLLSPRGTAQSSAKRFDAINWCVGGGAALWLATLTLDGPYRAFWAEAGFTEGVYLRDLLILLCACAAFFRAPSMACTAIGACFAIATYVGIRGLPAAQVGFGLKVFMPFLCGTMCARWLIETLEFRKLRIVLSMVFFVTVAGVGIDRFIDFPWKGLVYSVGGESIEGNRAWEAYDVERISGFARGSGDAAGLLLITGILIVLYENRGLRRCFYWLLGTVAIFLTTMKGLLLGWAAFTIMTVVIERLNARQRRIFCRIALVGSILLMAGLPLTTYFAVLDFTKYDQTYGAFSVLSFVDRTVRYWPEALDRIFEGSRAWLGLGAGSIGEAQQRYDRLNYNPGDNAFVYLLVVFGFTAFVLLGVLVYRGMKLADNPAFLNRLLFSYLVAIFLYGVISSVFENQIVAFAFGVVCAANAFSSSHHPTEKVRSRVAIDSPAVPAKGVASA